MRLEAVDMCLHFSYIPLQLYSRRLVFESRYRDRLS
jgi:hypothetical protein